MANCKSVPSNPSQKSTPPSRTCSIKDYSVGVQLGRPQEGQQATPEGCDSRPPGRGDSRGFGEGGDDCAKATHENMRVMVAGGDGIVGWVLGSLGQLYEENRESNPPTGIIPLGKENDLSRSFGWGGSFPFTWWSPVKMSIYKTSG
ncbi:hypothetical protein ZIOFF_057146 [Zingiber officinale]|uniref:DAGKc domain-containing protein n=1 Tax=Zingiber officinale TaxID=94328 RepID=A0A8J5F705_ZINOF|nr:hypothetical protein ZIOFF_057146 [Zingiber officinale]